MAKSKNKQKKDNFHGEQAFNAYYKDLFAARWEELKHAFFKENQSVEYKIEGAQKSYFLDAASIYAALCLPLNGDFEILDLCAAPGGKTLVLASRMSEASHLSSNERSKERKHRLSVVIEECLPQEKQSQITVSCSDGATWCTRQTECFDRILLDAPCSSERHVIQDEKYLNTWSLSRIKTVTMEQWALLSCAFRLLKRGGIMVYSTCALSFLENDLMVERLIKKFNKDGNSLKFLEPFPDFSEINAFTAMPELKTEKTQYGYQILPDVQNGAGPIYFSIIQKL